MKQYLWHHKPCQVLVEPVYKPKVKRNCLIELKTEERIVVPRRALRILEKHITT